MQEYLCAPLLLDTDTPGTLALHPGGEMSSVTINPDTNLSEEAQINSQSFGNSKPSLSISRPSLTLHPSDAATKASCQRSWAGAVSKRDKSGDLSTQITSLVSVRMVDLNSLVLWRPDRKSHKWLQWQPVRECDLLQRIIVQFNARSVVIFHFLPHKDRYPVVVRGRFSTLVLHFISWVLWRYLRATPVIWF